MAPLLASLLRAEAYPHEVREVRLVETHISWVLLTGELAYKIKRPVRFAFVDLRSASTRRHLCEEEVRLNRRFAPDLYLSVVPITVEGEGVRIGGSGEVVEHAVCMRQFARADELSVLLAEGRVLPEELAVFGRELASTHATLPVLEEKQSFGTSAAVRESLLANLDQLEAIQKRQRLEQSFASRRAMQDLLESLSPTIDARRAAGRVHECHGDLHSRNVVRHDGKLVAFDCLEFEPAFRWIDTAQEIAFLWMDLQRRGAPLHAADFLNGYLATSGDYEAVRLLRLYGAHCALVRAKVAALDARAGDDYAAYLQWARLLLEPERPRLILMSGLSGSGKTWLARRLAPMLGAVHLRSDLERKRLAGIPEHGSSGSSPGGGLYAAGMSADVYRKLAEGAADVLAGGFTAIVDATFQRREHRAHFVRLASEAKVPVTMVRCIAPDEVLRARIRQRAQAGTDASEADTSVLDWQRAHLEAIDSSEGLRLIEADTTRATVVEEAREALADGGDTGYVFPAGSLRGSP